MSEKQRDIKHTSVYFPPTTYEMLIARSKKNYRSFTSEVIAVIEKSLQEEEQQEQLQAVVQ